MANTLNLGTNGNWATKKDSLLAYNSENGNFKPLAFNFDRASSATVINKDGLIETVGSGEPRIDYKDDSKGALLLEPSRSNLIPYSEYLAVGWTYDNASIISNSIVSPIGEISASKLLDNTTNNLHRMYYVTGESTSAHTFSIFLKKGEYSKVEIESLSGVTSNITYDLLNATATSVGQIEPYENDWYRCSFPMSTTSPSNAIQIRLVNNSNSNVFVGTGTSGVHMFGAQLEQGSYATSYIPTQGSIGTRDADICNQTVPDGIIGQTEGTVFLDSKMALQSINNYQLFSINNGGGSDRIRILTATANRLRFIYQLDGGTTFYSFYNPTDYGDLTNLKIAFTYKSGDIKVYINGVLADSSTNTFTIAEKLIDIDIASSAGGYNQMLFNDIKLYNTALTDQELINLTTI